MRLILLFLICGSSLFASIGKISALNGKIVVDRQKQLLDANVGFDLEEKDLIITDDKSKAQITLNDGTVLSLGKNSKLDINEYVYDEKDSSNSKANFKFAEGTFKSITGAIGKVSPEKFKLETKSASIGIRGTIVVGNQEKIACTHGKIEVTSAGVTQVLNAGMMTNTEQGKPPTTPTKIEGNLLNEVNNESGPSENKSEPNEKNQKESNDNKSEQSSNERNSSSEQRNPLNNSIPSFNDVRNTVNDKLVNEKIETKIEEETKTETVTETITITSLPFYSKTANITSTNSIDFTTFSVPNGGATVTIATYGPSLGMDPVLILLRMNESGNFIPLNNNNDDDSWTEAGSANNAILSLSLEKGTYKLAISDYPFTNGTLNNNIHEDTDFGEVKLYFTSTEFLSFDNETITTYSYNSEKNNIAYIKGINSSQILNNKAEFKILTDSKAGTTISSENGYFVTISDSFNSPHMIINNNIEFISSSETVNNIFLDTEEIPDGSSWGYWANELNESGSINNQSTWVSGNQVTPPTSYSASFRGQVIGSVTNGSNTGYIKLDSNNLFKATIDIGAATITNSIIKFNDSLNNSWNGTFNTSANTVNVNQQEFRSSITNVNNPNISGSLSGKYYGTNGNVQSIGGGFNMVNGSSSANGVFKAREVLP